MLHNVPRPPELACPASKPLQALKQPQGAEPPVKPLLCKRLAFVSGHTLVLVIRDVVHTTHVCEVVQIYFKVPNTDLRCVPLLPIPGGHRADIEEGGRRHIHRANAERGAPEGAAAGRRLVAVVHARPRRGVFGQISQILDAVRLQTLGRVRHE